MHMSKSTRSLTIRRTKEESLAGTAVDKVLVWRPKNFHDTRQLFLLIFARKDGEAGVQLGKDATQTPHVNGHVIVHAKDDLRRTVEATLYIRVDYAKGQTKKWSFKKIHTLFVFKAAASKVNDFNGALRWMLQKNVLHVVSDANHR